MALIDNILAYYKHDELVGVNVNDETGTQDGTIQAGITLGAAGIINTAFDFDPGVSHYILTGLTSTAQTYTVSMWLNPDLISNAWQFNLDFQTGRLIFIICRNDGDIGFSYGVVHRSFLVAATQGTLKHYVWVLDATAGKGYLYINGVKQATEPVYVGTNMGGIVRVSGAQDDASFAPYSGIMDEFGIWERALTQEEITALYNDGNGLAYPFVVGTNMQINISDVWKDIESLKINIGNVWKDVVKIQQNIGDVWKDVFG